LLLGLERDWALKMGGLESPKMVMCSLVNVQKNDGKSQFFMGKSTISMAIFNRKLLVYQRVSDDEASILGVARF
jgi:hypothetical protein